MSSQEAQKTSPDLTPDGLPAEESPSAFNLIDIEHEISNWWKKERAFEKLVELGKNQKLPEFRFVDGPITANNPMGVHHAWGRSLKDIFIRYKCLNGFTSFFQNGFDCQGLWVEVEVEKELGFKGKPDIEKFGIENFSKACRERVNKFSGVQTEQSIRLGQWMRWDDSYYTHTDTNIQGIWHFLAKCHANGWLYQSGLSMPWCTRCGTSLSEHEMTGSYKDMSHLAVFIKLKVPKLNAKILVWTTTPWTLAANTALAVNPELTYVLLKVNSDELPLIVGADAIKAQKLKGDVLKEFKGAELVGLEYEAVLPEIEVQKGFEHKMVAWSDVDAKEGTGVVHIAPGCGKEDFELGKRLGLTTLVPVNEEGIYTKGYGWLEGKDVHLVAEEVAQYLDKNGKLFKKYMHDHSYPVCWRCKHELIFRLVDEWYISSKEVRPKLIEAAREVTWQPEHIGKRMEDWLKNMGDWCISRKRFWGLPLPFYKCAECQTLTVVKSKDDLKKLSGNDLAALPELHKPWIDTIKINCPKCSAQVSRVTEVGDCWLDAGIVPFSTRGYFESEQSRNEWRPADWICEMSEQVRLWFYSMLYMSVTLTGKAPYKRVLTYERVMAEDGSRFSKTGYMIKFDEAAERMGVDTMRYYFASQSPTNDIRFGYTRGDEARRQLISFWNIHSFFLTYASIDNPDLAGIKDPEQKLSEMDRWLLAKTYDFVSEARAGFEGFNTPIAVKAFENFVDQVSNWYIRANRRRFWKSDSGQDKQVGYWTLFQALRSACIVMSPIMPHLMEKVWQSSIRKFSSGEALSVHHARWPEPRSSWQNDLALKKASTVQNLLNLAHRLRSESQIKVRQPLSKLFVCTSAENSASIKEMSNQILNEINVKQLNFIDDKSDLFEPFLELDLKKAGPVLKGEVSKVVAIVNKLSSAEVSKLLPDLRAGGDISLPGWASPIPSAIFIVKEKSRSNLRFAEEHNIFVALDTVLTPELEEEGWVRDLLRHCQVQRKDSGFEVTDRIQLGLETASEALLSVIKRFASLIEQETLGRISYASLVGSKINSEVSLGGASLKVTMLKV